MRNMLGVIGLSALLLAGAAHAQTMVVDRGLPTANLNNVAGASRSNVSWALGSPYFIGDTFTLGGAAGTSYTINSLQTWVIARDGAPLSATLYTGRGAAADMATTSIAPTFDLVSYADGSTYQTPSGAFRSIYSVTFSGLNIVAGAGEIISFGVDGVNQGGYNFFNHASNAALSGSTQASADNVMSYYYHDGADALYYAPFDSNGNGFDKSSDINVRVFATVTPAAAAVPEPATWGMMILGFGVVGAAMRRRVRASEVRFETKIKRISEGAAA